MAQNAQKWSHTHNVEWLDNKTQTSQSSNSCCSSTSQWHYLLAQTYPFHLNQWQN